MASVDLLFEFPPATGGSLLFGETLVPVVQHLDATLNVTLPELTFTAQATPDTQATLNFTLPEMTFAGAGTYASRAQRPTTAQTVTDWQVATPGVTGIADVFSKTNKKPSGITATWAPAVALPAGTVSNTPYALVRTRIPARAAYQNAAKLPASRIAAHHQDTNRAIRVSRCTQGPALDASGVQTAGRCVSGRLPAVGPCGALYRMPLRGANRHARRCL